MIFGAHGTITKGARRYILNSAVCTTEGTFHYQVIDLQKAIEWLDMAPWESAIGYHEVAHALADLTGILIPSNRKSVFLRVNDQALVFRLVGYRPGSGEKYRIDHVQLRGQCEFGILTKIAPSFALPETVTQVDTVRDITGKEYKTGS